MWAGENVGIILGVKTMGGRNNIFITLIFYFYFCGPNGQTDSYGRSKWNCDRKGCKQLEQVFCLNRKKKKKRQGRLFVCVPHNIIIYHEDAYHHMGMGNGILLLVLLPVEDSVGQVYIYTLWLGLSSFNRFGVLSVSWLIMSLK